MRKKGMSIRDMAGELCKPYSTVCDWLVKLHRKGPPGRFNRERRRGKRTLDNAVLMETRRRLSGKSEHGIRWAAGILTRVHAQAESRSGLR